MGKCASKFKSDTTPPGGVVVRSRDEIYRIISEQLNLKHNILISDRNYGCYPRVEAERFLSSDSVDKLKYAKERFDCDDFALVLAGREKEWFATGEGEYGSSFGIVHGDIRKKVTDTKARPHAVNFFIDDEGKLWLVEPQTDEIMEPNSASTFWFTLC